jgi:hypothetical protein
MSRITQHAHVRLMERYGLMLSDDDVSDVLARIQNKRVFYHSTKHREGIIEIQGQLVGYRWDKRSQTVVSFLPLEHYSRDVSIIGVSNG